MTAPTWLPTARALAAVWTGPPLAQFVVSEERAVYRCAACDAVWNPSLSTCIECHSGMRRKHVIADRVTVPDLGSNAVGGEVLAALPVGWSCTSERDGTFAVRPAFGVRSEGATFGEAAALAFVAVQ